jgi:hypothetical protein
MTTAFAKPETVPEIVPETLRQQSGRVVQAGGALLVQADGRVLHARRAASCLLEPVLGDKVLLLTGSAETAYVLAVLERADDSGKATLGLPGDTEIRTAGGRLRLAARDGISMETASDVALLAAELNVSADKGEVLVNSLSFTGDLLRGCIDRIKLIGRSLDTAVERYFLRAQRSYRHIDETEQLRAANIHQEATQTLSMHAKNTLMTADELVKVDAEQIHMG